MLIMLLGMKQQKNAEQKIQVLPILDNWLIDENALIAALNEKTKLVALNFVPT